VSTPHLLDERKPRTVEAEAIRGLLLAIPYELRRDVWDELDLCKDCGVDLIEKSGFLGICHCENDE
jgi:hypothetical protein